MLKIKLSLAVLAVLTSTFSLAKPLSIDGKENIVENSRKVTVQADGTAMSMKASASAGDVAKKLANPVAAMISLPIQGNYQHKDNGHTWLTNVQPVIPFDVSEDWNIISRTIIPIVANSGVSNTSGVADIEQSAWLSPKALTSNGWIWGAGAVFLIPTDSDVSAKKWGAGPTGVALKQDGPWTYGGLFNHIWDFGGSDSITQNVSNTFMQPFLTYITPEAVTFALDTETQYDWEREQWTVPINFTVTKVVKVKGQILSVGGGVTYWAEAPENGPDGLGVRLLFTFIFPK